MRLPMLTCSQPDLHTSWEIKTVTHPTIHSYTSNLAKANGDTGSITTLSVNVGPDICSVKVACGDDCGDARVLFSAVRGDFFSPFQW